MTSTMIPFELVPGREAMIDDRRHVLDRVDGDDRYVWRRLGSTKTYKVRDPATGFPTDPDVADMLRLMADHTIELCEKELAQPRAAARRKSEVHVADARKIDPVSDLRIGFCRRYDDDKCNLSDAALVAFYQLQLKDASFACLAMAHPKAKRKGRTVLPWRPTGSTLRAWLTTRGAEGDRQQRDGLSGTGRGKRVKKLRHPPEILKEWAARAGSNRRDVLKNHQSYDAELILINRGERTLRRNEAGELIRYPRPVAPYTPVSYSTFWRLAKRLRSKAQKEARDGREAAEADYGGGGATEVPTHVGAVCGLDDSPVPVLCKIEIGTDVFVGQPTFTQLVDYRCNGRMGWDLSWDPPSSSTVLRTIAHASTPKRVPAHIERHAELSAMVVRPDLLIVDNLSAHHGRHVEDSLREIGTDVRLTGAGRPRDKAETEADMGTALAFAFKGLPVSTDPIAIRRHDRNDPPVELLPTIAELRERLDEGMPLLNLDKQKPLMDRSALSVFTRELDRRRVNVIQDVPAFRRAIGMVEYDVELRASGIERFTCLRFIQKAGSPNLFDKLRHRERPSKRTKVASVRVKIKYDGGDIGRIEAWDPVDLRWVTFLCDAPDYADGLPEWVHDWIRSDIAEDERAFCPAAKLVEYRARLFARQSEITQAAGEDERRRAARLGDTPIFKRVMGEYVEVGDEGYFAEPAAIQDDPRFAGVDTTGPFMTDFDRPTPRKSGRPPSQSTRSKRATERPASIPTPRRPDRGDARPPRPRSPANRTIDRKQKRS